MEYIFREVVESNGLLSAFVVVGLIMAFSFWISKIIHYRIPAVALAVFLGLVLALLGKKRD